MLRPKPGGRHQIEGLRNGERDSRCIVVDSNKLGARLLRPRRGNASHCIHHSAELADAANASAYISQTLGHFRVVSCGVAIALVSS